MRYIKVHTSSGASLPALRRANRDTQVEWACTGDCGDRAAPLAEISWIISDFRGL